MKKFMTLFVISAFVAPLFGCSDEKCAKDDAECIAQCTKDCIKDECGEQKPLGDTTINEGIQYTSCVTQLATSGKCQPSSCTE